MKGEGELILADCLDLLKEWKDHGRTNFIDLIYIDPPFNSKRNYNIVFKDGAELTERAFTDTWSRIAYLEELSNINSFSPNLYRFIKMLEETTIPKGALSYLTQMALRCFLMRGALKPTGSFYYHCDPTMSHYIKIVLDYIFGAENFRNEIVWCYKSGGASKRHFAKKHDTLFLYSKSENYFFQPTQEKSYVVPGSGKNPAQKYYEDENGTYTLVNQKDWWIDIGMLATSSKERLGYPTQKPEALLERIIKASSNEGDLVADFYMGGGTTIATAARSKRRYLGCDINERAIQITLERLEKQDLEVKKDFVVSGLPRSAKELRKLVDTNILGKDKNSKFALEDVIVKYYLKNVIGNEKKVGDNSIDGRFGFTYKDEQKTGLVQVTTGAGMNHFKAFCSEIAKGNGDLGVYVTFSDKVTDGMVREAKSYGQVGGVDKVQILTMEDLIDRRKQYQLPFDLL
jgi:site-specific DNA-methyltransferase (adenine-specific)